MKRLAIPLLAFFMIQAGHSSEIEAQSILAVAKLAGGCGMIQQMVAFQNSTKMLGGDEFLVRFLATESARLGFATDSYVEFCAGAINLYSTMKELAEQADAKN